MINKLSDTGDRESQIPKSAAGHDPEPVPFILSSSQHICLPTLVLFYLLSSWLSISKFWKR